MTDKPILESIDPEIGERIVSRRDALRGAGKWGAGIAFASVPVALGVLAKSAFGQGGLPQEIVDILNYALTLEYLEAEFYNTGLAQPNLIREREVFDQIRRHENAHVDLLKTVLGPAAVAKPEFDFTAGGMFPDVFSNYTTFVTLAQGFEDTGVRAYKGQAPELIPFDLLLTVALQIHAVEAMHASKVRRLSASPADQGWIPLAETDAPPLQAVYQGEAEVVQLGVNIVNVTPDFVDARAASESFDEPLTMQQVLAIASPFIVG